MDRTLTGATTLRKSGAGSDGNKGILGIPETSPSDCLVSYQGHLLGGGVLPLDRVAVGVFNSPKAQRESVCSQIRSMVPFNYIIKYIETRQIFLETFKLA